MSNWPSDRRDRGTRLAQRAIDVIVGARLAALRTARGLSRVQLGSALGTTAIEITNYESGDVRIPAARFIELCQIFKVNLQDLFPSLDPDHVQNLH
jgi:transcriptional regulator with XRE-family HTH domain